MGHGESTARSVGVDSNRRSPDPDDCHPFTKDGITYPNQCLQTDPNALCVDGYNDFSCQCSPEYTDTYCTLRVCQLVDHTSVTIIWNVLISLSGGNSIDNNMVEVSELLLTSLVAPRIGRQPNIHQNDGALHSRTSRPGSPPEYQLGLR